MTRPNKDVFGHCINCGKNMNVEKVVDGKLIHMFTGDKVDVQYLLNDGSLMRVTSCAKCKEALTGSAEELKEVMDIVWRGWQHEVETFSHWSEDRKANYLKNQKNLKIEVRADNKDLHDIDNRIIKIRNEKAKVK